jgi:uncharacterized protein (TIGR03083 family)
MDRKTLIRQHMTEARHLLLEAVAALDEETALTATANPEWRVRDVLAHLAASERGLLRNVERFLAGGELPADFSLDVWNRRQVAKRRDATVAELLAELAAGREEAWAVLDRLNEADLDVPGIHPAGMRTTVAGLFYTIANHELDHGNEIRVALGLPIVRQADWREAFQEAE